MYLLKCKAGDGFDFIYTYMFILKMLLICTYINVLLLYVNLAVLKYTLIYILALCTWLLSLHLLAKSWKYMLRFESKNVSRGHVGLGAADGLFERWLDHQGFHFIHRLICWWTTRKWGLVGGSRSLRGVLSKFYLGIRPFPWFSFLSTLRHITLLHHMLPAMISASPYVGPEAIKPGDHRLRHLKSWAKMFSLILWHQWKLTNPYTILYLMILISLNSLFCGGNSGLNSGPCTC
jgi:hypothetical protein